MTDDRETRRQRRRARGAAALDLANDQDGIVRRSQLRALGITRHHVRNEVVAGLVVEIDGGHHGLALHPVEDALRQNDVVIQGRTVLRIPVIGLRLNADEFMLQVVRAFIIMSTPVGH